MGGFKQDFLLFFQNEITTPEISDEICQLQNLIAEEEGKDRQQKIENTRRRHNYTPFLVELVKILAKEDKLVPLVQKGIEDAVKKKNKQ